MKSAIQTWGESSNKQPVETTIRTRRRNWLEHSKETHKVSESMENQKIPDVDIRLEENW